MNPEQMLITVEHAIRTHPDYPTDEWVICFLKNEIQCLPKASVLNDGNIFGQYNTDELTNGLTNLQWIALKQKMSLFFESKKS